jgi:hypothetical protein
MSLRDAEAVQPQLNLVTLKGIKYFRGSEGYGYNATIYIDGKRAALAINHGDGGATFLEFVSTEAKEKFEAAAKRWAVGKGKEYAEYADLASLFIEALLQGVEEQQRKEANARRGMPITVLCFAGEKYGPDQWEKEFYLGATDETALKEALAKYKVVEWRRL